jgi:hypothetical protein
MRAVLGMSKAIEFAEKAREAERLAASAKDLALRITFERLARDYRQLAEQESNAIASGSQVPLIIPGNDD